MNTIRLLLIIIGLTATASARAGLVGDTVECSGSSASSSPVACSTASEEVVTSPAAEFTISDSGASEVSLLTVNVEDSTIVLDALVRIPWLAGDRLSFTSLDYFGDPNKFISGVSIGNPSGITGFEAADLSFTEHSVSIDLGGQVWDADGTATLLLSFATRAATPVPEPFSLALLALGLLALGVVRRHQL